ncbi:restriction endonuclease [Chryseobacterium sp. 5_R23647]|uniref:restriction endonuclease n=1 Tax=Chryseobacterium sp. 5_R23647 TaxID=2258964 RepID=UPI000E22221D|nr:restriction endonuclease [Chryseobacterium sp. 5_R23647]REC42022.1 hypothetical protein DRF69_12730 [Chryseobacterium sp. 5_R23647]
MNLIILGEHSDDKGKQLEKLTTRILSHHGYKNITTNIIKNGGQEIDVEAIHEKPGFGNLDISNVLCECKAYTKAMAMSDWLKFLGKVFISKIGVNTSAYFIALNGVNGNVAGSYQDLKKQHKNIHLVTGEDLLKPLNQIYKMITVEEIQSRVKVLTDRNPTEISICYYNETLYFLLAFVDNTFSILSQNGQRLEKDECDQICKLISVNTNHINYLDLESEKVAKDRKQRIKKYIICIIFEKSDFISFDDLQTKLLSYKEIFDNLTELEINDILT